ncbi:hypothetical protein [Paraconexibacter algicola]|uniref:Uncharacterized protein n=1 Tax=Paraconexibacter algicola TaxID=2133960 RepID=A0A2T4UHI8_9ACTN|nr:hypothetical protein [Paraconexibacter algicola]PTL58665.1 hypothetical protein C7Y72_02855 [Paraconexibacter algicola]
MNGAPSLARGVRLLSLHVDALEITCSLGQVRLLLDEGGVDALERELAELVQLARSQAPQCAVETDWTWGAGEPVILHPGAMRRGQRYCLECGDWTLFVAAISSRRPRITVQCRAEYLLRVGRLAAWDEVTAWVEEQLLPWVGGLPEEDDEPCWRIARIDLAADVLGAKLAPNRLPHFVSRANARRALHDEPEGEA